MLCGIVDDGGGAAARRLFLIDHSKLYAQFHCLLKKAQWAGRILHPKFETFAMQDKRQPRRTRVFKGAKLILNNRSSLFDCTVFNLTNVGACLCFQSTAGIPNSFGLTFDSARSIRQCQVIWRTENKIGVSFG